MRYQTAFAYLGIFLLTTSVCVGQSRENRCNGYTKAVEEASQSRGLKLKTKIACTEVSADTFVKLASHLLESDTDVPNLKAHGLVLYYQGLIPKQYNYESCIVPALATNAAAFYSWKLKYFVVPNWIKTPQVIFFHEALHALQDQHYQIKRFATKKFIFDDENMAQGAILEGDSFSLEEVFLKKHPDEPADADINGKIPLTDFSCELPAPLSNVFDRMYEDGGDYIKRFRSNPSDINSIFLHPIRTSRSIVLKRLTDEPAVLKPTPGMHIVSGKIGLFGVEAFLRQHMKKDKAEELSHALRDDEFELNKEGDYKASYLFTSEDSAQGFEAVIKTVWSTQEPDLTIQRQGKLVTLLKPKEAHTL